MTVDMTLFRDTPRETSVRGDDRYPPLVCIIVFLTASLLLWAGIIEIVRLALR